MAEVGAADVPELVPVLLMVSGGSDSTALLELAATYSRGGATALRDDALAGMLAATLPAPKTLCLQALHVNHQLRGADADADEAFVLARCEELGVPCAVRRVDAAALAAAGGGLEAAARAERYRLADELLDAACERAGVACGSGLILTAHTLDDRVETFYMRTLVGTGPGGLASIPRVRGRVRRPLLDATRGQLRAWLRAQHLGTPDAALWREDATNEDGSNFRGQVRTQLLPVLRQLRPGFERPLASTMDLIAAEDEGLAQHVDSLVYRNLAWDGTVARFPLAVLRGQPPFLARRVLRSIALVVRPDARLEAAQLQRVADGLGQPGFATELSGGIRVQVGEEELVAFRAQ